MQNKCDLLDFDIIKEWNCLKKYKIVIFGAASKGFQIKRTLEREGVRIDCFCDSDPQKWNGIYEGLTVCSPYMLNSMMKRDVDYLIISCTFKENEIVKILNEFDLQHINFVSYWGIKTACIYNKIILEREDRLQIYDAMWRYQAEHRYQTRLINMIEDYRLIIRDAVKIFMPGKTASIAIRDAFYQAGIPCIHIHSMQYPEHILKGELKDIWSDVFTTKKGEKTKIVTSVREPISRDYSAFWQPFSEDLEVGYLNPIFCDDFQKMYTDFLEIILKGESYAHDLLGIMSPLVWVDEFEWFNYEIKKIYGIDIYEYPFDKEKGYQIIEAGDVQIFLFKVENLKKILPELSTFVKKDISLIGQSNAAQSKTYGLAYKDFEKKVILPEEYINHYYRNNPYMDHFYSKEEQSAFLQKRGVS